ncbi:MAG: hypothetical protein IIC73_02750, partial [Armatimonadetes bacterium]|nr:hypothetical protein [Armatimonadota bacterium]
MGDFISRRDLLKASAFGAVGATLARPLEAIAGPFTMQDYRYLVPRDKKLDPAWVRSLTERGEEPWISGDDLKFVGMPVGGFFAGTVYLGGDGTLWNWDIFNQHHQGGIARPGGVKYGEENLSESRGANYVDPPEQQAPFDFKVELESDKTRPMNATGWKSVKFLGQYPVGTVDYSDPDSPVSVRLEAFSPFVPLDVERSSYPATILRYTIKNASREDAEVTIRAEGTHPSLIYTGEGPRAVLEVTQTNGPYGTVLHYTATPTAPQFGGRTDRVFEDWEHGTYKGWTVKGTAFGDRPRHTSDIADYQGDLGHQGDWTVNSHNTRQGEDVRAGDTHKGELLSPQFTIERSFINLLIGGGNHPGQTCINLLINGEVLQSLTGHNSNQMRSAFFDVEELQGKQARLQIVDDATEGWGNIGIGNIVFSDTPVEDGPVQDLGDFGSFSFLFVGGSASHVDPTKRPTASLELELHVPRGESRTAELIVAWHFPNLQIPGFPGKKRWYASKWESAYEVAKEIAQNIDELTSQTLKWRDTWYDSTLPYWFLDRTFANTSILATNTCHRFDDGRFWFWEGIGCCAGTCTHVWSYAQAAARLFPEIESYFREHIDFGEFFHEDTGAIDYRAEFARTVAHDGQLGCIMRAYREHTMQKDSSFLERIWPRVKRAMQFIIAQDPDRNGLLEGEQYNTLDAKWYGPMSWLSSMYLAALRASQAMAMEMGDKDFARQCNAIITKGSKNIVDELFDGEYFFHKPDPAHPEANATNIGCHIDQLYGQSWCHWMGLERVVPADESKKAMVNLYKYNFTPDVGPYRKGMKVVKGGR